MRRTFASAGLLCIALALLHPANSRASYIGVFFDAAGTDCDAIQPAFTPLYWYVIARLEGSDAAAAGIAGAALRVTGVPTQWFHVVTPNPIIDFPTGNLLAEGMTLGFPCQSGTNSIFVLASILSFSVSELSHLVYAIEPPLLPGFEDYQDPVLIACEGFLQVCVAGVPGYVNFPEVYCNPLVSKAIDCPTLGVEPRTWGGVKTLYRE